MSINRYLGGTLLFMALFTQTSCSEGDKGDGLSLNADDLWDQMAAERETPMPVAEENSLSVDTEGAVRDDHSKIIPDPLQVMDIATARKTLQGARDKYQAISTALDDGLTTLDKTGTTLQDKQNIWRTVQLYLSRLTNLDKTMKRAISALDVAGADNTDIQNLQNQSNDLLALIGERIIRTHRRLDDFKPDG